MSIKVSLIYRRGDINETIDMKYTMMRDKGLVYWDIISWSADGCYAINTFRPKEHGWHFATNIFLWIFFKENIFYDFYEKYSM